MNAPRLFPRRLATVLVAAAAALSLVGPASADPAPSVRIYWVHPGNAETIVPGQPVEVGGEIEAADGIRMVNDKPDVTVEIDGERVAPTLTVSDPKRADSVHFEMRRSFAEGRHTLAVTARSSQGETVQYNARFTASKTRPVRITSVSPFTGDFYPVGKDVEVSGFVETDDGILMSGDKPDVTVTIDGAPADPEFVVGSKGLNVAFRLTRVFGPGTHTLSVLARGVGGEDGVETTFYSDVTYDCQFRNGFAQLQSYLSPGQAGRCITKEYVDPLTGDTLQPTTGWKGQGGLFVYRASDGFLGYTDGYQTWLLGPQGFEGPRLNTERYPWERERLWPKAIREGTYTLPIGPNDENVTFTLQDGKATFAAVAAPDAPRGTVTLPESFVWYGDFDGDGYRDAVIVLAVNRLGPGNLIYAVPARDVNGKAVQMGAVLLGDRVVVNDVGIGKGEFHVDMVTQGPNDLASNPTSRVQKSFAIKLPE